MRSREELKKGAKNTLKRHYVIFVFLCVIAAFLGSEFANSLSITKIKNTLDVNVLETNQLNTVTKEVTKKAQNIKIEPVKKLQTSKKKINDGINKSKILERRRGVFAGVVNNIDSGSFFVTSVSSIRSIIGLSSASIIISIISSLIIFFIFWYFIVNVYRVVCRRMFLEGRIYSQIKLQDFAFLFRVKKWSKAAFTMFLLFVYKFLWGLTIIGGIIKRYSYFLVPYIVAENPDINARDAIRLSRDMMRGYKWKCFVLDISFIGWQLLGILTLGLLDIAYTDPYRVATFTEFYCDMRGLAKKKNIKNSNLLCDKYLFEKADPKILNAAYYIDPKDIDNLNESRKQEKTLKSKIEDTFGINLSNQNKKDIYEKAKVSELKINSIKSELAGFSYPNKLYIIKEKEKTKRVEVVNYLRHYNVTSLILMFFIFSFIGWIWELSLHLMQSGKFVNRGVMHGPWLPIYGFGGILVLVLLNKLRKKPVLEFFSIIVVCGIVEYFTAFFLELAHDGEKWWDYSGYFLNLHGRICAEGLLVFAIGGTAVVYFIAPFFDNMIKRINKKVVLPLVIVLLSIFVVDQVYSSKYPNSGDGITDYKSNFNSTVKLDRNIIHIKKV